MNGVRTAIGDDVRPETELVLAEQDADYGQGNPTDRRPGDDDWQPVADRRTVLV